MCYLFLEFRIAIGEKYVILVRTKVLQRGACFNIPGVVFCDYYYYYYY